MAAHLIWKDSHKKHGYYLVDGYINKSLRTKTKREAEAKLKEYNRGRLGLTPVPTVAEYYRDWIVRKVPPLVRESLARDYKQIFKARILPHFGQTRLSDIRTKDLVGFQAELLGEGLAVKTVRNVLDAAFRSLYRDARVELGGELEGRDPFIDLMWPRQPKEKPDPFTAYERDAIVAWYAQNEFFYFPLVAWQFHTGMRPSETFALEWKDIDFERGTVSITKSRNMGAVSATKTAHSDRIIQIDQALIDILKLLPSRELGIPNVFVGKRGMPMTKKWAEHFWRGPLKKLDIRPRKFYACRHTTITKLVKAGYHLKAIGDYVGTSAGMIESNYCARLQLMPGTREIFESMAKNSMKIWLRGRDLNPGPQGYEPCELPDCSTPRQ